MGFLPSRETPRLAVSSWTESCRFNAAGGRQDRAADRRGQNDIHRRRVSAVNEVPFRNRVKRITSGLDIRGDRLLELLDREDARRLAVDEERGGRVDAELDRPLPHLLEAIDQLLVLQALVELLLAHAGLLGDGQE